MTYPGSSTFPGATTYPGVTGTAAAPSPVLDVLDCMCRWFGGPYNPDTHDYRTPTVPGLGFVQRTLAKQGGDGFRLLSMPGQTPGALLVVSITRWRQHRESGSVGAGWLLRTYDVRMELFARTASLDPVESWDATYRLSDAIAARILLDPSMGSGGYGPGTGLWFGEGQSTALTVDFSQPTAVKAYTQQLVTLTGAATQYIPG